MDEIEIRKYKKEDISGFYKAVNESKGEISKWLPWCDDSYSIKDTEEWINETVPKIWESKKGCEFIIVNLKNNKIIGGCCLEQIDKMEKEASIGYWIRTSETKKGLATLASIFLIEFGLYELELETIKVIPSIENEGSKKVAEKLPYEKMIRVKNGFQIRDKTSDALIFIITKKSYEENRK